MSETKKLQCKECNYRLSYPTIYFCKHCRRFQWSSLIQDLIQFIVTCIMFAFGVWWIIDLWGGGGDNMPVVIVMFLTGAVLWLGLILVQGLIGFIIGFTSSIKAKIRL